MCVSVKHTRLILRYAGDTIIIMYQRWWSKLQMNKHKYYYTKILKLLVMSVVT